MSNEELAAAIQAGERNKLMELWGQVRRLVHDMAYKRLRATNGAGGVALDDLMQAGFLGFLEAVKAYDPAAGFRFTSYLTYPVKSAFSEAEGRRSEKQKRDPIFSAVSIDAPLDKGEGEPLTLADVIPDPQAAEALDGIGSMGYPSQSRGGLARGPERGNPAAVLAQPNHGGNLDGYRRTREGGAQAGGGSPAGLAASQDIKGTEGLYVNWRISPFSGGFERGG